MLICKREISLEEGLNIIICNNQITFIINKLDFKNTLKEILNKFEIEDLHITEPPIDEVIGKILNNKK